MSRVITTQGEWERIKICYLHHMIIMFIAWFISIVIAGNDSNLLIVFYVQIMPDDFVMQLHR
ncbi:hypothetical protein VR688_18690, partial [Escherichia coli]